MFTITRLEAALQNALEGTGRQLRDFSIDLECEDCRAIFRTKSGMKAEFGIPLDGDVMALSVSPAEFQDEWVGTLTSEQQVAAEVAAWVRRVSTTR